MCLGEVVQVTATLPDRHVETMLPTGTPGGRRTRVSLLALEGPVAVGDWLLVHSGFALERLTAAEAHGALALRSGSDRHDGPDQPAHHPDQPAHPDLSTADAPADIPTGDPS